jgi:hypothetical protein
MRRVMTAQLSAGAKLGAVLGFSWVLPQVVLPPAPTFPAWFAGLMLGAGGVLWIWRQTRELLGHGSNGHARAVDKLRASLDGLKADLEGRLAAIETQQETAGGEIERLRHLVGGFPEMISKAVDKIAGTFTALLIRSETDQGARMDRQDVRMDGLAHRMDQQRGKR